TATPFRLRRKLRHAMASLTLRALLPGPQATLPLPPSTPTALPPGSRQPALRTSPRPRLVSQVMLLCCTSTSTVSTTDELNPERLDCPFGVNPRARFPALY